jgi:hypothetical protein
MPAYNPNTKNLYDQLNQKQLESFQAQKQGIANYENMLKQQGEAQPNALALALSGASDILSGGNAAEKLMQQQAQLKQAQQSGNLNLQKMRQNLTDDELAQLKMQLMAERGAAKDQASEDYRRQLLGIQRQKLNAKGGFTPGEESSDKAFGKEYQDWNAQGGYSGVEKQLNSLEEAKASLKNNPGLTGPWISALPDAVRRRTSPESFAVQQQVEQAVQGSLRQTLGSQFTEKEGERIMRNSYDPALPAEENIKKLDATIKDLQTKAQQKALASKYFEENGTLKGFKASERPASQVKTMSFEEWKKAKGK